MPGAYQAIVIGRSVQSPLDFERRITSAVHGTHQHGAYLPYQIGAMADPGARLLPFADTESLSLRRRQPSRIGRHHGPGAERRQDHLAAISGSLFSPSATAKSPCL